MFLEHSITGQELDKQVFYISAVSAYQFVPFSSVIHTYIHTYYTYIHTYTHTHIHTYIHTYIHFTDAP